MTEYYNQEGADTTKDFWRLAWIMQESFTKANLSMWIYWDLVWRGGSMVATYGTPYPAAYPLGFQIKRTFYGQALYSKFVRPNWKRILATAADTGLKVVAFTSAAGDSVSLVMVNPYATAITTTPTLTKTVASAGVWVTDATRELVNLGS